MKVSVYSAKEYDRFFLTEANERRNPPHELFFYEDTLNEYTIGYTRDHDCVCVFVNDRIDRKVLSALAGNGVKLLALRSAGFNHVDIEAAYEVGIKVVRVPAYSPFAVAEHTVAMILTLNRKTHRAFNRVRDGNFSLERMLGFDLHGKTVGVVGTGKIGGIFCRIMLGFGCKVIAYDVYPDDGLHSFGVEYVELNHLFKTSDIISLQCPLTPETHHLINGQALNKMKDGVMIINTSRGALIDTQALIYALKSGKVGYLGMDVYEQEENIFFRDLSDSIILDDLIMRLITFPNVLITSHQAFFTDTAMKNIAETTLNNISDFEAGKRLINEVMPELVK